MKKVLFAMILMIFMLNACAPATSRPTATLQVNKPIPIPTLTPAPADSNLIQSNVYLDSAELLTMESSPLQFMLALKGNLPTPCNQLQVNINQPDAENKIVADVYSVTQADKMCAQVLQPFEENLPLGSFPAGHYILWVNGEQIAEFDA